MFLLSITITNQQTNMKTQIERIKEILKDNNVSYYADGGGEYLLTNNTFENGMILTKAKFKVFAGEYGENTPENELITDESKIDYETEEYSVEELPVVMKNGIMVYDPRFDCDDVYIDRSALCDLSDDDLIMYIKKGVDEWLETKWGAELKTIISEFDNN